MFVESRYRINTQWRLTGRLEYIRSDFDSAEIRGNVIEDTRKDKEWNASLSASQPIFGKALLNLGWNHTDTDSNFAEFSYSSNIIRAGILYPF